MKVFLLYWHPEAGSFNGAMFRRAEGALRAAGHEVRVSDLAAMRFDPVSSRRNFVTVGNAEYFKPQLEEMYATERGGFAPEIESEIAKLEWCDLLVMQFPLWWFGMPAAVKGWVDRVFAMGRVYGGGRFYENGVFRGKRAMLSITTGSSDPSVYERGGFNGDLLSILRPIHRGILNFVGFDVLAPHVVHGPAPMSDSERAAQLDAYAERLANIHLEHPIDTGTY